MEHKGEQSSFGKTMMQALKLLRLMKRHVSRDEATLISEEIKPVAITIIELLLSEGINQLVNQLASQSAENFV